MNPKKKAVLDRIEHFQEAITKGCQYLESGQHADWHGFRPLFAPKVKDGKVVPPHKDWVKHVFLSRLETALRQAEKALEKLGGVGSADEQFQKHTNLDRHTRSSA
jgi:hypothetical protein